MRILFDTRELEALGNQASRAGYDVAGIGGELGGAAGRVAIRQLVSFRINEAATLVQDIGAVAGGLGGIATRLEGGAATARAQIGMAWWSQRGNDVLSAASAQARRSRAWWSRGGNQLFAAGADLLSDGLRTLDAGEDAYSRARWLSRATQLVATRGIVGAAKSARRWRFGGSYDRALGAAFVLGTIGIGTVLNARGYGAAGKVTELGGRFGQLAYDATRSQKLSPLQKRLGWAGVAVGAYSMLAGSDRREYEAGQRSRNPADRQRSTVTYAAKGTQVFGQALMLVPGFQVVGAGFVGVGLAVEAGAWLSRPANRNALERDVKDIGSKVWRFATPW